MYVFEDRSKFTLNIKESLPLAENENLGVEVGFNEDNSAYIKLNGGDISSKEWVEDQLDSKVGKITGTSANPRIYGVDEEGEQTTYFATQTPNANTIPLRDASGRFQVEDGVAPKQAVNKSQLGDLEAKLNENMIRDPKKTYLVYKGETFPDEPIALSTSFAATVDWGDGNVETFPSGFEHCPEHTYTDDKTFHLITIGGLRHIPQFAFNSCKGLIKISITDNLETLQGRHIGDYAFFECSNLEEVIFPSIALDIGVEAFSGCEKLNSIVIPDGGNVADAALATCKTIILKGFVNMQSDSFSEDVEKIIVPKSLIDTYKEMFPEAASKIVYEVDSSDIPADKVPFKYSTFISSNDGDSWKLNDSTKNLGLNYQDENSHSNLSLEKDYIEISGINGTGTAKISLASNVLTLDSEGTAGQHKLVRITPDKVTIGNSTDNSLIEIDSTSTKFNNRPQVRDNGNYVNVALADDLNNYATVQSESADNYYAQLSNENGVISARIFQNGSDDTQNLTIDKTGVKVLGKKVATEDQLNNKLDALYAHRLVSVVKINNVNYTLVTNLISSKSDAYTSLETLPTTRMEDMSATLIIADSDGNEYKSQVAATYYTDGIFVSGVCIDSSATMTALQNNRTTVVTAIETYTPIKIA